MNDDSFKIDTPGSEITNVVMNNDNTVTFTEKFVFSNLEIENVEIEKIKIKSISLTKTVDKEYFDIITDSIIK